MASALVSAALALTFLVGVTSLVLGLVRLGFLDSILSKPMLVGFVLAVAAILICDQMPVLLGLECGDACKASNMPIDVLIYSLKHIGDTHWVTLLISAACCTFMFAFTAVKKRFENSRILACIPEVVFVVVATTLVSYWMGQERRDDARTEDERDGLRVQPNADVSLCCTCE